MLAYIRFADSLSAWFGKIFAWAIMIMTLGVSYEVFARYLFGAPTPWAFDLSYMLYGTMFMMGGAYTLSRDGHVRGDFLYRLWRPRTQGTVELILYIFFFFPGVLALVFAGWKFVSRSWGYAEVSSMSPANIPIYQFKSVIVAAGLLLIVQGIAQVMRCLIAIRTDTWLRADNDVEELEETLKREGLAALDGDADQRQGTAAALPHASEAVDIPTPDEVRRPGSHPSTRGDIR